MILNKKNTTKFICVSGKGGSGKDTFSSLLSKSLEARKKRVVVTHYADPLKMYAKSFFGWNGEKDAGGRTMLQHIGTDIARKKNENFWVDMLLNFVDLFENEWDYIIVADCRFPNEIERIRERYECCCIRIKRERDGVGMTYDQRSHSSETALDEYQNELNTIFVNNNGTINDLEVSVEDITNLIEEGI